MNVLCMYVREGVCVWDIIVKMHIKWVCGCRFAWYMRAIYVDVCSACLLIYLIGIVF